MNAPRYQSGFGNQFATEAVEGVLPQGRNSPQQVAHGLYAELVSGSAFTAPRAENRRSWLYRRQPSVVSGGYDAYAQPLPEDRREGWRARCRRIRCAGTRCQFRMRPPISSTACAPSS